MWSDYRIHLFDSFFVIWEVTNVQWLLTLGVSSGYTTNMYIRHVVQKRKVREEAGSVYSLVK